MWVQPAPNAVVGGSKAPEQAPFISTGNMLESQNSALFEGWAGLTSLDGGTARARGRKRQGGTLSSPEPQRLVGLG
jgi:hypothetical protein